MAKKKDIEQKAPAPGPAPSPEEMHRKHIEGSARDRFGFLRNDLDELLKGDLKKSDKLDALVAVGEGILSLALQTKGRLRAAAGHSDAFLEMKAANVKSGLRKAGMVFDTWDKDMTAFADSAEILKPILDSIARTVKDLDIPGMKAAIAPTGPALFDEDGAPAQKAVTEPSAPEPAAAPAPNSTPAPEPQAPVQAHVVGREFPTLGMGAVIDVEPELPAAHPLDGRNEAEAEEIIQALLDKLEEAGVEEGLKRKDWSKAYVAWIETWPEDCNMSLHVRMFDRLTFALETRKPISWAIPTEAEMNDHARKLAIAAGE